MITKNLLAIKTSMIILVVALVCSLGCSQKVQEQIGYENGYNNVAEIEGAIKMQGVLLEMMEGHSSGKGILKIKDRTGNEEVEEETFCIVEKEQNASNQWRITNEIPTNEGNLMLSVLLDQDKYTAALEIQGGMVIELEEGESAPTPKIRRKTLKSTKFITKSSKLLMDQPFDPKIGAFFKLEYTGIDQSEKREIELICTFYVLKENN